MVPSRWRIERKNHSHHQRELRLRATKIEYLLCISPLTTTTTIPCEFVVYAKKEVALWREKEASWHSSVVWLLDGAVVTPRALKMDQTSLIFEDMVSHMSINQSTKNLGKKR